MNGEKINLVPEASACSGCGACMTVCPKAAISMQEAADGCKYPVIDPSLCVGCQKCLKICAYRQEQGSQLPQAAYAAVGKDDELVENSASGGVFASLALSWIRSGGLVAGAVMDLTDGVQVYHVLSDCEADIRRMQGSKYVQSDAWRCYAQILEATKEGRQVLFSGTPCQVAAVKKLTGNPDNLTTIDLICHGVPPVKMLNEYVQLLEKRFNGKVESFRFRDKSQKKNFTAGLDVRYGKMMRRFYLRSHDLSFYKHFLESANYRENCYNCPFARLERGADLTIGDYWGIEKQHADDFETGRMPKTDAWSSILVNTEKGSRLLNEHAREILLYASNPEWVAAENHQLQYPTPVPEGRSMLFRIYEQEGYKGVEKAFVKTRGGWLKYHLRLWRGL